MCDHEPFYGDVLSDYFRTIETPTSMTFGFRIVSNRVWSLERLGQSIDAVIAQYPPLSIGDGTPNESRSNPIDHGRPLDPDAGRWLDFHIDPNDAAAVVFRFHHAGCDGYGAVKLIYQIFRHYQDGRLVKMGHGPAVTTPASSSPGSSSPGSSSLGSSSLGSASSLGTVRSLKHFFTTVAGHNALVSCHAVSPLSVCELGANSSWHRFENEDVLDVSVARDVSEAVIDRLRRQKIPLNDFGVAANLCAIADITEAAKGRRISVMNPVNLRGYEHRNRIKNGIGLAFIRRRHDDIFGLENVLDDVNEQLCYVRKHGVASELEEGLRMLRRFPKTWAWIRNRQWFRPTVLVTCKSSMGFGRYRSPGGIDLTGRRSDRDRLSVRDFTIFGPLGGNADISVVIWRVNGAIRISIRVAKSVFESSKTIQTQLAKRLISLITNYARDGRISSLLNHRVS